MREAARPRILIVFGTRPEAIKLAPVIHRLELRSRLLETVNVTTAQHTHLLHPFVRLFRLRVDHDLDIMRPNQTPSEVLARVVMGLEPLLIARRPDLVLVQGDTTSALAAALTASNRQIPVAHIEAGLRSGNLSSPFPEEMNRQLIGRLARDHFAPTRRNHDTLLREGVSPDHIFVTGNTVVDSLHHALANGAIRSHRASVLDRTRGLKRLVVTCHRRESFGEPLEQNLLVLRRFVERHSDVALVFPVHPNPSVLGPATRILADHPRVHLLEPLGYLEFISLLSQAWLIVSDSGGVQEEAPTLGKPVLILRENTERPEVLEVGVGRLVGVDPARLAAMLEEAIAPGSWITTVGRMENPFGRGDSARRIARILEQRLTGTSQAVGRRGAQLETALPTAV